MQKSTDGLEKALQELRKLNTHLETSLKEKSELCASLQNDLQKLESIHAAFPVGIYLTGVNGEMEYVNRTFLDITGIAEIDKNCDSWEYALAADDKQQMIAAWQNAVEKRIEFYAEYRCLHDDGKLVWVHDHAVPIYDKNNCYRGFTGICIDITAQKQAEHALIESESRFRTIFESAADAIFVIDIEGNYIDVNQAACKLFGYGKNKILHSNITLLRPDLKMEKDKEALQKRWKNGAILTEVPLWRKDGSQIWVDMTVEPLPLPSGEYVLGICRDVTKRRNAVRDLEKSVKRTENILASISDGFFVLDNHLRIIYFNQAAERLLNREKDNVLHRKMFDAFPELQYSIFEENFRRALEAEKYVHFETYFNLEPYKNWYDVRIFPYEEGISVYFRVISDRKIAEDELLQNQEKLNLALKAANASIWQYNLKTRQVDRDERYLQILGYSPDDEIQDIPKIHENDLKNVVEQFQNIERGITNFYQSEHRVLAKKGEWKWLQSWGTVSRWEGKEKPLIVTGIVIDITTRKKFEEELRISREQFKVLAQNAPEIISRIDIDLKILYVNPVIEHYTGHPPEQYYGRTIVDIFGKTEKAEFISGLFKQVVADGKTISRTFELETKNGLRYFEWLLSPECDSEGKVISILSHASDYTDIKTAEEEKRNIEKGLLEAQKLESLGVLAGGIAHDFNNLLMAIMGNISMALIDLPHRSPVREYLETIDKISHHAAELTSQILAYSGKGRFLLKTVALNPMIEEMKPLFQHCISKNARLKINLAPDLPFVDADTAQLRQVLLNLITNASEAFAGRSGVITLETRRRLCDSQYIKNSCFFTGQKSGEYLCIRVADDGVGMPRDTLKKIFEPFYTTKVSGRGLGLSVVMGIIKGHNGLLTVRSQPGKGSEFEIALPPGGKALPVSTLMPEKHLAWQYSGTALLADDEERVLNITGKMLMRIGFKVLLARNGLEAVELYKNNAKEIDLVILDLSMPDMDGIEAMKLISAINPQVKIFLSSGYDPDFRNDEDITERLAGYIKKPYRFSKLIEELKSVFEKQ